MKNLIITIGAVILIITISGYQLECNKLLRAKEELKFAADEGAATASLCVDWKAYGDGLLKLDKAKAISEGEKIIKMNLNEKNMKCSFYFDENGDWPKVKVVIIRGNLSGTSEYEYVS